MNAAGGVHYPTPPSAPSSPRPTKDIKVCIAIGGASTIENGGVFAALLADRSRLLLVDNLASSTINSIVWMSISKGNGVNQHHEAFVTELSAMLKPEGKELTRPRLVGSDSASPTRRWPASISST